MSEILGSELIAAILDRYELPLGGVHGPRHWGRVLANGLRLARDTGADRDVVSLFAVFHDACRRNEGRDPGHGGRGADLAADLHGDLYELEDARLELLVTACAGHTDGGTEAEPTVQTCWDADRLDLGRVAITPDPRRLCTAAAREPGIIAWAEERSRGGHETRAVREWLRGRRRTRGG